MKQPKISTLLKNLSVLVTTKYVDGRMSYGHHLRELKEIERRTLLKMPAGSVDCEAKKDGKRELK